MADVLQAGIDAVVDAGLGGQGVNVAVPEGGGFGRSLIGAMLDFDWPQWCSPDGPKVGRAWIGALKDVPRDATFQACFGFHKHGKATTIPDWAGWAFGLALATDKKGNRSIAGITWWNRLLLNITQAPLWFCDMVQKIATPVGCPRTKLLPIYLSRLVYGFIGKYLGFRNEPTDRQLELTSNFVCPNVPPSAGVAIAAYMHDEMTLETAKDWASLEAWCPYYVDLTVSAEKYRHSIDTLIHLYYRGIIGSETELRIQLRKQGVLDQVAADQLISGSKKLWGVMEIHRNLNVLRPGRVAPDIEYSEDQAKIDLRAHGYDERQIRQLLWLKRKDISHRFLLPPYRHGQMTKPQLIEYLKDDGWLQRDIDRILPFYQLERSVDTARVMGAPPPKELVKDAAEGTRTAEELKLGLMLWGYDADIQEDAVRIASQRRTRDRKKLEIRAVRSGLASGELTEDAALVALGAVGVAPDTASEILQLWALQATLRRRPASLAQLCEWSNRGWVSVKEYKRRLRVAGFSPVDISRIISVCNLKAREKQEKIDEANAKRRVAEEKKAEAASHALEKARASLAAKKNGTVLPKLPVSAPAPELVPSIVTPAAPVKPRMNVAALVQAVMQLMEALAKAREERADQLVKAINDKLATVRTLLSHIASREKFGKPLTVPNLAAREQEEAMYAELEAALGSPSSLNPTDQRAEVAPEYPTAPYGYEPGYPGPDGASNPASQS